MSRNQSPHPSASIRRGATLVPETIAVVTAFLRGSGIDADRVPSFVRSVHSTLIEIATSSGAVSDALHTLGYIPKDGGLTEFPSPIDVAAALVRPLDQLPAPVSAEVPEGEPTEERVEGIEEVSAEEAAISLPLLEPKRREAPTAKPAVPRRKLKAKSRERQQLELGIAEPAPVVVPAPVQPAPLPAKARPIPKPKPTRRASKIDPRTSVLMDYILCLEDGKRVRDLGAHIQQAHGMTPSEYRAKWKLPESYPMIPPGAILKRGEQFEFDTASGGFKPLRRRA